MLDYSIIGPFILPLALIFIIIYPFLLDRLTGIGKKHKPLICLTILIAAIITSIAGSIYAESPSGLAMTTIILFSTLTVSSMAVLLPHLIFREQLPGRIRTGTILISSLFQIPFLFAMSVHPESWPGGPAPVFADYLPGLGIFFDAIATYTGYSIFFIAGVTIGLCIEVAVVSVLVFGMARALAKEREQNCVEN